MEKKRSGENRQARWRRTMVTYGEGEGK